MKYKQIEYDQRPIWQSCREPKKNLMQQTAKVMMLFQDNEMRHPGKNITANWFFQLAVKEENR